MLEKDPKKRISAADCIEHPYFEHLRQKDQTDYDYVGDEETTDLDVRMSKINEE